MTPAYRVQTTPHFDRALRKLERRHPELLDYFRRALAILGSDPYNRTGTHPIRKLQGVSPNDPKYRLRLARFRFRYDIEGPIVYLKAVALRSEATYR